MKGKVNVIILCIAAFLATACSKQQEPNLLVIHTDEHSFRTLGCYRDILPEEQAFMWGPGVEVTTPNIDRLAHEGALCDRYYASSPVCTPSRASMVTGMYPQLTGAPKNGLHLDKSMITFAQVLKDKGYATSYVGKWHLEGNEKYVYGNLRKFGFDDNRYMFTGGHAPYYSVTEDTIIALSVGEYERASDEDKESVHFVTDFLTDISLEILERDKDKPFCLMLSIPDPHTPDYARPPYQDMYNDLDVKPPRTFGPELAVQRPSWGRGRSGDKNDPTEFNPGALKQYFGMVKCIDDNVGRLLSFLENNKLAENTIVVFTADHGDMFYEHNRRNKGVPYEASAKIPFLIRWPDKIKEGKIIHTAYTNVDFMPTILGLMNVKHDLVMHGTDTSEDFLNSEQDITDDRITYFAKTGGWWVAAVDNRYKLVLAKDEKPWLLDIEKDPDELINYYSHPEYQKTATRMQEELFRQMEQFKEPGLLNHQDRPYITE